MNKLSRQLILASGVAIAISVAALFIILRWVDAQEIPDKSDSRGTLRFIAAVYPLLPGRCDERCVIRTIKISNLVALSAYGKKSPADFSNDIGAGFSLLNTILSKGGLPDRTAEYELSLERLMFFNRMNAFAIIFGHRLDGDTFLEKAVSLQSYAYDEETKAVLQREAFIYRVLQNKQGADSDTGSPEYASELAFPDAHQLMASGWALCAARLDKGAEYLNHALPAVRQKRFDLIHAVTRNLDAPLIAAAEKHMACQSGIHELKKLLSGG